MFTAATTYQFVQMIPLPPSVAATISRAAQEAYSLTPDFYPGKWTPISIDAGRTLEEASKSCAYLSIFVLTMALVKSRSKLEIAMWTIVGIGFFQAVIGLADTFSNGALFGDALRGFKAAGVSGTYTNRNHFAGLMEMSIPFCATLLLTRTNARSHPSLKPTSLREFLNWLLGRRLLHYLGLSTMAAALLSSTSRGGLLSFVIANTAVTCWSLTRSKNRPVVSNFALASAGAFALAVILGAQPIIERLDKSGLETDRKNHRELAYSVLADFPAVGSGSGTWRQVYPAYQSADTYSSKIVNHVHNDYLQLLVEQGAVGFLLFGSAVLLTFITIARGLDQSNDPVQRAALYGSLSAMASILIHSFGDYNLHIPANAAIFSFIMAIGLVAARISAPSAG